MKLINYKFFECPSSSGHMGNSEALTQRGNLP